MKLSDNQKKNSTIFDINLKEPVVLPVTGPETGLIVSGGLTALGLVIKRIFSLPVFAKDDYFGG